MGRTEGQVRKGVHKKEGGEKGVRGREGRGSQTVLLREGERSCTNTARGARGTRKLELTWECDLELVTQQADVL